MNKIKQNKKEKFTLPLSSKLTNNFKLGDKKFKKEEIKNPDITNEDIFKAINKVLIK